MSAAHTTRNRVHPAKVASGNGHDPGRASRMPLGPAVHSSVPTPGSLTRRIERFGRVGALAIPLFALFAGLAPRADAAFSTDPAEYARYLATGRYQTGELVVTIGLGVTGVLSLVALTALLIRGRGRRFAIAGLIAGLAGSTVLLVMAGSVIIRADRVRDALLHGRWARIAINAHMHGRNAGLIIVVGAALLIIGWMLLGVAMLRIRGMNRADGAMLIISGPLLYLGGMVLRVLPTMGSFLLLAAGLGIAFTAGRVIDPRPVVAPTVRRSPTFARLVHAGDFDDAEPDLHAEAGDDRCATPAEGPQAAAEAVDDGLGTKVGLVSTHVSQHNGAAPGAHAPRGILGRARGAHGFSIAWPINRGPGTGPTSPGKPDDAKDHTPATPATSPRVTAPSGDGERPDDTGGSRTGRE